VQVQRRETERQTQMRLNSHAYLSKLEADEEWTDIRIRDLSRDRVAWGKLESGSKQDLPMDMSREEILAAILPVTPRPPPPPPPLRVHSHLIYYRQLADHLAVLR
jgi:hypothetical protein